jgi:hypothetical protein
VDRQRWRAVLRKHFHQAAGGQIGTDHDVGHLRNAKVQQCRLHHRFAVVQTQAAGRLQRHRAPSDAEMQRPVAHRHDCDEVVLCLAGWGELHIDGQALVLPWRS